LGLPFHIEFLKLLKNNKLFYFLLDKLNEVLPYVYDRLKGRNNEYSDKELKYVLTFSVGGFWNNLNLWLENYENDNPEDLARMIKKALKINYNFMEE